MSNYTVAPSTIYDSGGTIQTDAACRKCSYNLRGLQHSGRCPECGTPVGVSVLGDYLRYSHPDWLREVGNGLSLILWGILISVVVSISAGMIFSNEPVLAGVLGILANVVGIVGTWKMTTPDPSGIGESTGLTARKVVRIAVLCGVLASIMQLVNQSDALPLGGIILGVLTFGFAIIGVAGEFAKLHYIGLLAQRLPDDPLTNRARFLKWALAVTYIGLAMIGMLVAIGLAAGARPGAGGAMFLGILAIPLGLAVLVFSIMSIILISRMKKAVQAQVPLSMEIWQRAANPGHTAPPPPPGL